MKCHDQDLGRASTSAGGGEGGVAYSYGVREVSLPADQRDVSSLSISIGGGRGSAGGVGGVLLPEVKLESSSLLDSTIEDSLNFLLNAMTEWGWELTNALTKKIKEAKATKDDD